ncbi:MAG: hypothetical protein ACI9NQ_002130 [Paracoccaceae bacterium]|jgi:hypothetical protein
MPIKCTAQSCKSPDWMQSALKLAGIYNILFGIWAVGWPNAWFEMSGMEVPRYPFLWQCIGMIVGVYGLGYLAASRDPLKHWPIVAVGFLGKVFGPIGFVWAASQGELPWAAGWLNVFNDLIWLVPFAMILWAAACLMVGRPVLGEPMTLDKAAERFRLTSGETLKEASQKDLLAIVFLRHFGCTFTRQLLRNLREMHERAEAEGARLVLVHMLQQGEEDEFVDPNGVVRIADPRCDLYRAFGLGKGGFLELFGPKVWYRGAVAFFRGCGAGMLKGDGLQMPGAFLLKDGKILQEQKAHSASDLPNVEALFGAKS